MTDIFNDPRTGWRPNEPRIACTNCGILHIVDLRALRKAGVGEYECEYCGEPFDSTTFAALLDDE